MVVALIALNASIVAVTVYFARNDPSASIEPDYYAKALGFEETIRLREESARLGWTATPTISWSRAPGAGTIRVELTDRDGASVTGADVSVVAFASARAAARQSLDLLPAGPGANRYESALRLGRAGLWHLRITATRDGETFFSERDVLVPDPPAAAPR